MSDRPPESSDRRIEAVGPATWTAYGELRERRVVVALRGILVLTLDDGAHLASELLKAVRAPNAPNRT